MANPQLLNYIRQQRQKGLTDDTIKTALLQAGWQQPDIDDAWASLTSSTPASRGEPASPAPGISPPSSPQPAIKPAQPPRTSFAKRLLIFLFIFAIVSGLAIWLIFYPPIPIPFPFQRPQPTPAPSTDQAKHRQDIYDITTKVLDHINKRAYIEALSYFRLKADRAIIDQDILTALAVTKIAYQQPDGQLHYQLPMENIQITGETAQVDVELSVRQPADQVHLLTFDFHFSNWHIINVRFEEQLDFLTLARSPEVLNELTTTTTFVDFLPAYTLSPTDVLTITFTADKTALNFTTPQPPASGYLITVYEPYDQRQSYPLIAGQIFNQTHPLTTNSYGIVYVYANPQNLAFSEDNVNQLLQTPPLLRIPFKL